MNCRASRVGIHLDEEQLSADLVEIEIERLAAAAVRADDATHQPAYANRNAQRLKPACRRLLGKQPPDRQSG